MKSKLFKHMSLPEMYNLDVGDGNKIYIEASGKKEESQLYLFMEVLEVILGVSIIVFLIQTFLGL